MSSSDQSIVNLGALGWYYSEARRINNRSQVIGRLYPQCCHYFLWEGGIMKDLSATPDPVAGAVVNEANDINDAGQIAGTSGPEAIIWQNGSITRLGTLVPGGYSRGLAINGSGVVAGEATDANNTWHAVRYLPNSGIQDLGQLPGYDFTTPVAINASGQVTGTARRYGASTAFLWSESTGLQDLGLPPGATGIEIHDMNDAGEIVGWANVTYFSRAVKWSPPAGWTILGEIPELESMGSAAYGINNAGTVVGIAMGPGPLSPCGSFQFCAVSWPSTGGIIELNRAAGGSHGGGVAYDINDLGQAVGQLSWATLWNPPASASGVPVASTNGPFVGIEGFPVVFDASTSTDPDGDPLTFTWVFSDGFSDTGQVVNHTYGWNSKATPFTVYLTARDPGGASHTVTSTATIANFTPVVDIEAASGIPARTPFVPTASFADPGVRDGAWVITTSWGDGTPDQVGWQNIPGVLDPAEVYPAGRITHTYQTEGTYSLILSVTDADGAIGADTTAIVVVPGHTPAARVAGPVAGSEGTVIQFDATSSSDPDGDGLSFAWTFGDGGIGTGPQPSHSYLNDGSFQVSVTATDPSGLSHTATASAVISEIPPAVHVGPAGDPTSMIPFDPQATLLDGSALDGPWLVRFDWGDGSASQTLTRTSLGLVPVTHTFGAAGPFRLVVSVTDNLGRGSADTTWLQVLQGNRAPTAAIGGPYFANELATITFNGSSSTDPDGDPLTYTWLFGDGASGTGAMPSHAYVGDGTYTVSLTVSDPDGFLSQATTTATIISLPPVVDAGPDRSIPVSSSFPTAVSFAEPSSPDGPWTVVQDWGDGTSTTVVSYVYGSPQQISAHRYPVAGVYQLTATVTDADGAVGSDVFTLTVTPNGSPTARVNGPYTGSEGINIQFSSAGTSDPDNDPLDYLWAWGDGTPSTFAANPVHRYANNGSYIVTLTVVDPNGFWNTATTTATIANVAPTGTFNRPASANEGAGFNVSISNVNDVPLDRSAGFTYAFNCGSGFGSFSTASTSSCPAFPDNRTAGVGGRVQDRDGGIREYLGNITIKNVIPKVSVTAGGSTTIPQGSTFTLNGSFTDPGTLDAPWTYSIAWGDATAPATGTSTPGAPIGASHVFNKVGIWTVRMTVTDKNGGKGTSNAITVTVQ